ncbi:hypothetical protein [Urbifossiella limnaea]|uniref:Uncharacterized protein n=1 Tax=Urbifossiella limnaea TaxID=2528023 RepID=A0A517XSW8_9BACT|nr:hypothetical protein [Urbifossiella limnaea]QDU20585.1 hypothetical protein ETAA1_25400 [Urbifossiella limnaea]
MSWYLTIRPDPNYSRSTPLGPLVEYLRSLPELMQDKSVEFRNAPGSPWVSLVLAQASMTGNYAVSNDLPSTINVVEIVCGDGDEDWYEALARLVATFLRWEVVEEHSGRTLLPGG